MSPSPRIEFRREGNFLVTHSPWILFYRSSTSSPPHRQFNPRWHRRWRQDGESREQHRGSVSRIGPLVQPGGRLNQSNSNCTGSLPRPVYRSMAKAEHLVGRWALRSAFFNMLRCARARFLLSCDHSRLQATGEVVSSSPPEWPHFILVGLDRAPSSRRTILVLILFPPRRERIDRLSAVDRLIWPHVDDRPGSLCVRAWILMANSGRGSEHSCLWSRLSAVSLVTVCD